LDVGTLECSSNTREITLLLVPSSRHESDDNEKVDENVEKEQEEDDNNDYDGGDDEEGEDISNDTIVATIGLFLAGIVGGILASKLGSGSDTMAYVYGLFIYNPIFARAGKQLPESALTVSSVVIMPTPLWWSQSSD